MSPPEDLPLYFEPILAWRVWRVICEGRGAPYLRSVTHRVKWPERKPVRAHCVFAWAKGRRATYGAQVPNESWPHECPNLGHQCGIHSLKRRESTMNWTSVSTTNWTGTQPDPDTLAAVGTVLVWGKVLRFSDGYLSEFAYPQSLSLRVPADRLGPPLLEVADVLRRGYGVTVEIEEMSGT